MLGKTAVGFYDHVTRHASLTLEAVNVLGEQLQEDALLVQQTDERVRDGGAILARVQFLGKSVEGQRIVAEIGNVEDGLGVWQAQASEVGVQACVWAAEVGDAGRGADAGARLQAGLAA